MVAKKISFIIPESVEITRLSRLIARDHSVKAESPTRRTVSYYDSFDWRLYRQGLFLAREGNRYRLVSFVENETIAEIAIGAGERPRRWQDFPRGELQARLQQILSVRALLHLMRVENLGQTLRLQDSGDLPVVRVELVRALLLRKKNHTDLGQQIVLQMDGQHAAQWQQIQLYLGSLGVSQPAGDLYLAALAAAGLEPGAATNKLQFQLSPEMPAGQAVCIVMRELLGAMKRQEAGLKADIDTEFLHDHRVACRRARSLVGQLKSVFPPEVAADLQRDLTQLGQSSNRLRDLDVYLLKEVEYRAMLAGPLQEGLNVLFRTLADERRREHALVVQALADPATVEAFARWRRLLAAGPPWSTAAGQRAVMPIRQLARRRIRRRIRRVLKAGDAITDDSTQDCMHRLRIQGKQLRYLLEFFASLFPPRQIAGMIGQLKLLQDNLGSFNDLAAQQRELNGFLARCHSLPGDAVLTAAAIGGLITQLRNEQLRLRGEFARVYRSFARPRRRKLYTELFG